MNREDALKTILISPKFSLTFHRLLRWDENLSISDNAKNLNFNQSSIRQFVVKYNLKFKKIAKRTYSRVDHSRFLKLWDENLSIIDNAKIIKRDRMFAYYLCKKYRLGYLKITKLNKTPFKHKELSDRNKRIIELRKKGYSLKAIGALHHVTRQRIEQICPNVIK